MEHVRVLLVDDHAVVRAGYRHLIEMQARIRVAAEAANGAQAYRRLLEGGVDVVVMDLSLPGIGGLEVLRRMRQRQPQLRALAFSMHEERVIVDRAFEAGALGYLCKRSAPEILLGAIETVAAGRRFLDPRFEAVPQRLAPTLARLSLRELEIFRQLAEGRAVAQIASAMSLSDKTVANYNTAIRHKLGAGNRAELARIAIAAGLLPALP
ncbi:response regulator [Solimonas variicoloris]|uniref:response regulator n=1 Tax=Solimonas variicoloris TaxID=254408 RepID=UPI000374D5A1|nr:response regulator transcription factor [Solimonas variicoloris]